MAKSESGTDFWELYEQKKNTDVVFEVKDDEGMLKEYHVHKLVLSSVSDVFNSMFFGPKTQKNGRILVEDMPDITLEQLIEYAYKKKIDIEEIGQACRMAYAAKRFMIQDLLDAALSYILKHLKPENVCQVVESDYIIDASLNILAFKMIGDNFDAVLKSKNYYQLSVKSMMFLIQRIYSRVEPVDLFDMTYRWSKNACVSDNVEPSPNNIRARIENFLPFIYFLQFTAEEFVTQVLPTYILTVGEAGSIGSNLSSDLEIKHQLPPWCSRAVKIWDACLVKESKFNEPNNTFANCAFSVSEKSWLKEFDVYIAWNSHVSALVVVKLRSNVSLKVDTFHVRKLKGHSYVTVCLNRGHNKSYVLNAHEVYQLRVEFIENEQKLLQFAKITSLEKEEDIELEFPCDRSPGKKFVVNFYPSTGSPIYRLLLNYEYSGLLTNI